MAAPASNKDVRQFNRVLVLRALLARERASQTELAHELGLSLPTVRQNMCELVARGWAREEGLFHSTGGRKARAFVPVADARVAVGVDITASRANLVLVDLRGAVRDRIVCERPFSLTDAYFGELGVLVHELVPAEEWERLCGVGVSLPGIVSADGSHLTVSHALGLEDVATDRIAEGLGVPCTFMNDANAAGFAELWSGFGGLPARHGTLVYLSLSDSVGGSVFHDGALVGGDHQRAGEFGHMTLVPGGRSCYCGKTGCVDAYCSARMLSSYAAGDLDRFFQILDEGDARARAVWEEYLEMLAVVVNNLHMALDCDVIAGGYLGSYLHRRGAPLKRLVAARNTFVSDAGYLHFSRLGRDASALGAALSHIETAIQTLD